MAANGLGDHLGCFVGGFEPEEPVHPAGHRGVDEARFDGGDLDTVGGEAVAERFEEGAEARFGGVIGGEGPPSAVAGDGGDSDDNAVALGLETGGDGVEPCDGAGEVDVEDLFVFAEVVFVLTDFGHDSRGVAKEADGAHFFFDLAKEGGGGLEIQNIVLVNTGTALPPAGFDAALDLLKLGEAASQEGDLVTGGCEASGIGGADPGGGSYHDGVLVLVHAGRLAPFPEEDTLLLGGLFGGAGATILFVVGVPSTILILANPKAGGGLAGELVPYLARDLQEAGHPVEIFLSSGAGQIRERARDLEKVYRALCVVGGDGTVREVVEADPGPEIGIAVCPTGTANVLAKELGLPKSPRETAAMVSAGHRVSFDAGRIRSEEGERRFFLCVGLGLDGKIVAEVHAKRGGGTLGKLKYVGPILGSLWNYEKGRHFFVLEDGERLGPFEEVLVTNVAQIGGFWKLPRGISWDDGLLDVLGFSAGTATSMLGHVVKGMFGGLAEGKNLVHRQIGRVRIETETGGEVQVDGDPGPRPPLEIEVCKAALSFFVPGPLSGADGGM